MHEDAVVEGHRSRSFVDPGAAPVAVPIPEYLEQTYWWAYVHPLSVRVFERQWLVNCILWGNFALLRDAALGEFGESIDGRMLQVACVYGDFSQRVSERLTPGARLDLVDVVPAQLRNASGKLGRDRKVSLHRQDSSDLRFDDASFDQVVVFFLLHEQPTEVRKRTIREALRVTRPGGKVVFVDYHRPAASNPVGYAMRPVLRILEPFALDLWEHEIQDWVPDAFRPGEIRKQTYFGDLYQKVVMIR